MGDVCQVSICQRVSGGGKSWDRRKTHITTAKVSKGPLETVQVSKHVFMEGKGRQAQEEWDL